MRLEELLVSTACLALLAAALLPIVVDGATLASARMERLSLEHGAALLAADLQADLDAAGRGLEGARGLNVAGDVVPVVQATAADRLRLVLAVGASREVARLGPARYRAADVAGLRAGHPVAAVGLRGGPAPAPAGYLLHVDRGTGVLTVAWPSPAGERLAADGPPRALLPVAIREYGVRARSSGVELWRRDDGGPRQPIIDGVAALRVVPEAGGVSVTVELIAADGGPVIARAARR